MVMVGLPLAALMWEATSEGTQSFWDAVSSPEAVAALKLTLGASLAVSALNAVLGTITAWVLVRDDFRGKTVVNAIIDLPFALPTIVAGLTLLALYGPTSPVGIDVAFSRTAIVLALMFVTLPFVVRTVQPVLQELDPRARGGGALARRIDRDDVPPGRLPEHPPGDPLGRRARFREGGRRVRVARDHHREHPVPDRGVVGAHLRTDRERRLRRSSGRRSRPAGDLVPDAPLDRRHPPLRDEARPMRSLVSRLGLRAVALVYLAVILVGPLAIVFWRTFEDGFAPAWDALTTPETLNAFKLTLIITAIAVPVNTVFGIVCALAIVRKRFWGKGVLNAFIDLPLALSPVVVGLALFLLYGQDGWFGSWLDDRGIEVLFALPAMVIATIFVSLPFVAREVVPTLREIGDEQEQAARTLGASGWQTFWRITLPSIRWAVIYGVILTTARCLGEYGAVAVVSGRVQGADGDCDTPRAGAL